MSRVTLEDDPGAHPSPAAPWLGLRTGERLLEADGQEELTWAGRGRQPVLAHTPCSMERSFVRFSGQTQRLMWIIPGNYSLCFS